MMEQEQIAPHVEDISQVLGDKVETTEIERMLKNYIEIYKISVSDAKRAIVKHFGGSPAGLARSGGEIMKLADLDGSEQNFDLLVRLVAISPKQVTVKGSQRVIHTGILADESGTRSFTAWTSDFPHEKGDVLVIQNAYSRQWRDKVDVQFGERVRITAGDDSALPSFEDLGGIMKISDLRDGLTNVSLMGRIIEVIKKEVEIEGLRKKIVSGTIGDTTGKVNFTCWSDTDLEIGELVRIDNGYVKSWRGIPQYSFDERNPIERLPDKDFPTIEELKAHSHVRIGALMMMGGAVGAEVNGVIIDIRAGSGLVFRCPQCNRVIQKSTCNLHGKVDGLPDLRIKAIIDDGTGGLTAIINRPLTEKLFGKDLEQAKALASKAMTPDVIYDELRKKLLIESVRATGRVTSDDFGLTMLVDSIEPFVPDVVGEAKVYLEELEQQGVE